MPERVLKPDTASLCPDCLEEIPAAVKRVDGQVILEKECPAHGPCRAVIEPDADFYERVVREEPCRRNYYALVLPITLRCNLDCTWCYLPDRTGENDWPQERLKRHIAGTPCPIVSFSGGEPTVREDLPELIGYAREQGKIACVVTNGVKLADYEFLKRLKEAGLQAVVFSFNGFERETDQVLNKRPLLEVKLKALRNLCRIGGIAVIVSMTLAEGVNDKEVHRVLRFALSKAPPVVQVRMRNATELGRYQETTPIPLSRMVDLVAGGLGVTREELLADNRRTNADRYNANYFCVNLISILRQRYGRSLLDKARFFNTLRSYLGGVKTLRWLVGYFPRRRGPFSFGVEIFYWPNPRNIDLGECRKLHMHHVTEEGEVRTFWDALFHNDWLHRQGGPGAGAAPASASPAQQRPQAGELIGPEEAQQQEKSEVEPEASQL